MIREEAVKWIENIKKKYIHGGDEAFDDARRKAIDMAIEALKERAMTREKATQELTEWIKQMENHGVPPYSAKYKALKLAIETLSAEAKPTMPEDIREALMRLTMCAREECGMCKYKDECGFEFQYNISTENMHTILDALQAEPIVRCKDCKNAGRKMGTHYHCEQQMSWHEEEYFCNYGERREL